MLYLATISSSFRKSSLDELGRIAQFSILEEFVTTLVIESAEPGMDRKLAASRPIFVYSLLPLGKPSKISEGDYLGSVYGAVLGKAPPSGRIRVECFDVNCKTTYSSKDMEVYIGLRLEREGFAVGMEDPKFLLYAVLINGSCYPGCLEYNTMPRKFINAERHYHAFSGEAVSRSELKLMEAFDEFGTRGGGLALDLGAAPGGWSRFLARSGYRVLAVDNGELDYRGLALSGIKTRIVGKVDAITLAEVGENGILHIRANARDVKLEGVGKLDLVVNDMNLIPSESVRMLLSFSTLFREGTELIMTVKCVDRKAEKHLANARKALLGSFEMIGAKVLPSNRQELTIHARYTGKDPQASL